MKMIMKTRRFGFQIHAKITYEIVNDCASQPQWCNRFPSASPIADFIKAPDAVRRQLTDPQSTKHLAVARLSAC